MSIKRYGTLPSPAPFLLQSRRSGRLALRQRTGPRDADGEIVTVQHHRTGPRHPRNLKKVLESPDTPMTSSASTCSSTIPRLRRIQQGLRPVLHRRARPAASCDHDERPRSKSTALPTKRLKIWDLGKALEGCSSQPTSSQGFRGRDGTIENTEWYVRLS